MRLHVGCAMWTHKAWQGRFLPHPAPAHQRLRSYARWCNAVEGNTTFYATPARDTVASWAQQTGPDFRFVVKLPKAVTHERRLTDAGAELRAFLAAIEPLGPRVHALWIQLPGSFSPSEVPTLAGFLRRLPRSSHARPRFWKGYWSPRAPSGFPLTPPPSSPGRRPARRSGTRGRGSRACRCGRWR